MADILVAIYPPGGYHVYMILGLGQGASLTQHRPVSRYVGSRLTAFHMAGLYRAGKTIFVGCVSTMQPLRYRLVDRRDRTLCVLHSITVTPDTQDVKLLTRGTLIMNNCQKTSSLPYESIILKQAPTANHGIQSKQRKLAPHRQDPICNEHPK
ncbi:hypothetical protein BP00DRAFT_30252 [Aspergillus indologenus CBS 114.80]|uniref:Uncharacterized protein n=1 Tax=Aspergillus indologenus CBS 114.80 TaxID=1450541 RepID=A0A2V5HTU9_9EURO|nr:hypothetical protein BP00DRAFT_30252 [Aspergillus indologenus CBS 114.80]